MITPELVSFLKLSKEKGVPFETTKNNLLGAGWNESDINQALATIDVPASVAPISPISNTSPVVAGNISNSGSLHSGIIVTTHKKNKFFLSLVIFILVLLLGAGVVYSYIQKLGPFAKFANLYSETNLLSGLLDKSSQIRTSSYAVSASLAVGPRDSDARPFTLAPIAISPESPKPLFATLGEQAKYLPEEFGVDLTFSAKTDWETVDLADWAVNLDANGDFGDLVYKVNVDALKKGEDFYIKINNIPSILLSSFSNLKGEWIKISPKKKDDKSTGSYQSYDPFSSITDSFTRSESSYKENRAKFMELLKKAAQFADEEKLIGFKNKPKKETINERELYRYDLKINRDSIVPFYQKLRTEAEQVQEVGEIFDDSGLLAYLQTKEFNDVFDYYQANTFLSIWVDDKGFPAIIKYTFRLVPPDSAEQLKDKQANLEFSLSFSDINKPVNIEIPVGAKNIEDMPAFKTARNKGTNASIKANLSNMRSVAEIYYDKNNSYGATVNNNCNSASNTLFSDKIMADIIINVKKSMEEGGVEPVSVSCYSNRTAWAISAKLIDTEQDSGYWCVDSKGSYKLVTKPISSAVCPK
ncbi:MAG: hypothetical protein WC735_04010 [Candidatus Paceibacterota bacterium]|jgi:hypothetical protein